MKKYDTKDIRNVALVGHGGCGKTSLAEAFLYDGKVVNRLGTAGSDSSNFDYEPEEIKRQHTVQASVGFVEWQNTKINFVDTPGDQSFLVETQMALGLAADAAVIVVSCPDGVQVVTEQCWQFAIDGNMPRIVFVNKMDRDRANWDTCLEDIRSSLSDKAAALQIPIGKEAGFEGLVDLLSLKAYRFDDQTVKASNLPAELKEAAATAREKLIEDIASSDDELLETYLGAGELTEDEIHRGLQSALLAGTLVPVLCGSATANIGVQPLLDLIATSVPAPDTRPPQKGHDDQGNEVQREPTADQPFSARVFKTIGADIGKISVCRIVSGTLLSDSNVYNAEKGAGERTGALYSLIGKKRDSISEADAGDIVGLAKLKVTKTGHTLCDPKNIFSAQALPVPPPVIKYAISPKSKADDDKLGSRLHDVQDEDVALRIERDPVSKNVILAGMGQSHIEMTVEKLGRMGIAVDLLTPKIPYLETIKSKVENVEGRHKKQSGGRGQFGVCYLHVEPLPRGGEFEFVNAVVGGSIPRQFIPAIEKGVRERMQQGVIAGYPVTDIKVTVFDGKYHAVDSDGRSFERAGSKGFREAVKLAKAVLLEPIMELEIISPDENLGDIMGDINSRRGRVLGMDAKGKNQIIKAHVPMAETLKYSADLRSITGGRGSFTLSFSHYDEVPGKVAENIVAEAKIHEEED